MPGWVSSLMTWLGNLDAAWVGVIGVFLGALIAGFYSRRSAGIAAQAAVYAAAVQAETSSQSAGLQLETAEQASRVQLVGVRETHRIRQLDSTYLELLIHLQRWNNWVHDVNRYNYAQYHYEHSELPMQFPPRKDDPRDVRDLNNPNVESIEKPPIDPPSLRPSPQANALLIAYGSTAVLELLNEWDKIARDVGDLGRNITESERAIEWKEIYPEVLEKGKLRYWENVDVFDERREAIEKQIRLELTSTFRIDIPHDDTGRPSKPY
ncbi:MAG: hypothetical protein M3332_11655 [Actinomycetota bacterium]|nr:hypothetical protein [Actinomycetota bacterium]